MYSPSQNTISTLLWRLRIKLFRTFLTTKMSTLTTKDSATLPLDMNNIMLQFKRINDRIASQENHNEPCIKELPPLLSFENMSISPQKNYREVKDAILQGEFSWKEISSKTIIINNPVRINTGDARRLSEKEQEIVQDYVERLIAADVVEHCNSPWSDLSF